MADAARPAHRLRRRGEPAGRVSRGVLACGDRSPCRGSSSSPLFIGTLAAVNYRGVGAGTLVSNVSRPRQARGARARGDGRGGVLGPAPACTASGRASPATRRVAEARCCCCSLPTAATRRLLTPWARLAIRARDAAFALFIALRHPDGPLHAAAVVVIGALPDAAHSERPLADVARVDPRPAGRRSLIAVGALISVYGYLSANLLTGPARPLRARRARGFPARCFAHVHPRFHTPYVSIVVFALLRVGLRARSQASPGT